MAPRPDLHPDTAGTTHLMRRLQGRVAGAARFDGTVELDETTVVVGVDQAFPHAEAVVSAAVAEVHGKTVETATVRRTPPIGYVPGLLSFREGAAAIEAVRSLAVDPDVVVVDGNGRIHPRQAGLATHLGVVLDVPTVGVAKSLLCGEPAASTDGLAAGDRVAILAGDGIDAEADAVVGYAVQTKQYAGDRHVNPVITSPGHRIGATAAADIVLDLAGGYKLPSPIRRADRAAGRAASADPKDDDASR